MDSESVAQLEVGRGVVGNADQGGTRQVTLIAEERWRELMAEVVDSLSPAARRANLVLSGIVLDESRGRILRVGPCRLQIGGETRPCEQMEQAARGLQAAMRYRWGGGAFAQVVRGGIVTVGDTVAWEDPRS